MDWSGVDYCDVISCLDSFWRHPFTAEHPLVNRWWNATFLQIWWRNSSRSWMAWGSWGVTPNADLIYLTENLFMTLFDSILILQHFYTSTYNFSQYCIFAGGFLKRLGDVGTVLLVSVCSVSSCPSDRLMKIRSDLCVENKNLTGLLQLMAKWMCGNINWYFHLTH